MEPEQLRRQGGKDTFSTQRVRERGRRERRRGEQEIRVEMKEVKLTPMHEVASFKAMANLTPMPVVGTSSVEVVVVVILSI